MKNYDYETPTPPKRSISKGTRIMAIFAGAVVLFVAIVVVLNQIGDPVRNTDLVWLAEKTTHSPGTLPRALRDRLRQAGKDGGALLTAYAVGEQAVNVASDIGLDLDRGNGKVDDSRQQASNVDKILKDVAGRMGKAAVSPTGFSLYAALHAAADEAARTGQAEVWLTSTVLTGSLDPFTISSLSAGADPEQAVDEVLKTPLKDLDLQGVDLHIVFLTPVGAEQRPLDPRSESWREKFTTTLADDLGAQIADPIHDNGTTGAWPNASTVPPIIPFTPPQPPAKTDDPRIDEAAFAPDSADLIDRPAATAVAAQAAEQYRSKHGKSRISVTGYCARYGDPGGARDTSAKRANAVAQLLRDQGIPAGDISASGVGFDELATPGQDATSPAQRVVVIKLVARS
ncbi:OmpA family protein [Amycolatopsis sp., V23-08]|uniref:OmpA family protein n=1 Tax=Amycolatopsis heterodermiae TaxID=3110235 RepID=A0ABU5QYQ8_9PSEU|nr:OmpA family protein [Amycolatopsis sp., V23-08]MEA5359063.1 OmpA family protein [Amycolatopsis sp., V23-08]